MKNLLQTHRLAWARGVKIALDAEGIPAVVLDEYDRGGLGGLGVAGMVRVAVVNDHDLAKAQAIVARLTPPRTGPPPSWRWQKHGLVLLVVDFVLFVVWLGLLNDAKWEEGTLRSNPGLYALAAAVVILFIGGALLIVLGPRADKGNP